MFLFIEINKTILIKYRNDISAWSVYLIIKNLQRRVRYFEKQSSMILLHMILLIKSKNKLERKSQIWHFVMLTMLRRKWVVVCYWKSAEIENLTIRKFEKLKLSIACANEWQRQWFLIIANFMRDYKEQMMMTDVKSNQHCLIYTVFSKQTKNLQKFHKIRT